MKYLSVVDPNRIDNLPNAELTSTTTREVLQLVSAVGAVIALIVITIAALKYIFSQGDPNKISNAKNTIIYALIGLVIAITAFSIVTFVITEVAA